MSLAPLSKASWSGGSATPAPGPRGGGFRRLFPTLGLAGLLLLAARSAGFAQPAYLPGHAYFGAANYIEYLAGDMPLIISVPHGGTLRPDSVPDRKEGEFTPDAHTEELARALHQVFHDRFGHFPHVIICRLQRHKIDCNRDQEEGAGDNPTARQAWQDFHKFVAAAHRAVEAGAGRGLYIDLHGQSHAIKRVELGYCLNEYQLANSDRALNQPEFVTNSTLRCLAQRSPLPFATLLRGTNSLGALLAEAGYPAVPSPAMPDPGQGNEYFGGGYNVRRYSSLGGGGGIDGLQLEANYVGARDTPENRTNFCRALARALEVYFTAHYQWNLTSGTASSSAATASSAPPHQAARAPRPIVEKSSPP